MGDKIRIFTTYKELYAFIQVLIDQGSHKGELSEHVKKFEEDGKSPQSATLFLRTGDLDLYKVENNINLN